MFTLKLYTHGGSRRILEVESFHIGAGPRDQWFEVSAYFDKAADDPDNAKRFDVGPSPYEPSGGRWDYAFIENSSGKTTEKLWPSPKPDDAEDPIPAEGDQIKRMVDRFLMWRLPPNFSPDNGISFKKVVYDGMSLENQGAHWPVGANLLDATQAEAMVRHLLAM